MLYILEKNTPSKKEAFIFLVKEAFSYILLYMSLKKNLIYEIIYILYRS